MEYALALVVLLAIAALVVSGPLRRREAPGPGEAPGAGEAAGPREAGLAAGADRRAELEAAKQAKYREIRDAELDFRMGKLSEADFQATDRELRAQTIAIVRELDGSRPR